MKSPFVADKWEPVGEMTRIHFDTDRGGVYVLVGPDGPGRAKIRVEEEELAKAATPGECPVTTYTRPEMDEAVNRFGTGLMLSILRYIRKSCPAVKEWVIARHTGANPDSRRVMEV